jgi:hypothetical protein
MFSSCNAHDAQDEHITPVIPAHKPRSFEQTVEQLEYRFKEIMLLPEPTEAQRMELQDMINWLPELAGDSELKKPQWEQVVSLQPRFDACLQKIVSRQKSPELQGQIESCLQTLRANIPFSTIKKF